MSVQLLIIYDLKPSRTLCMLQQHKPWQIATIRCKVYQTVFFLKSLCLICWLYVIIFLLYFGTQMFKETTKDTEKVS